MTDLITALKPTLMLYHAPVSGQIILGTHRGKHVIAKMSIPGVDPVEKEEFRILFAYDDFNDANDKLLEIVTPPKGLKLVKAEAA